MRFSPCTLALRVTVVVGLISILSLVNAVPAVPNSDPKARPASLLGRSYTRRVADLSYVPGSRLASNPLGRAARFNIAQSRSSSTLGSLGAADNIIQAQSGSSVERREILLSHQQMAPPPVSSLSPSPFTPSAAPATPTVMSIPPKSTAPSSESRVVAHKSKSKPKKTATKPSKHSNHKSNVIYPSAE
ncbi:hypothetical protein B0H12DRAFT_1154741 [Mycena haematopus]|nr:hypothetical protein B0H12DRAFT_1154741 [Mycena haematopus]